MERLWGTLQDRLVTELRLAGITTIDDADAFLPGYLARHDERFMVPAADPEPGWRSWPSGLSAESVFASWYRRTVTRDHTLAWAGEALGVPRRSDGRSRAGQEVTLAERLDGSLWAELDGRWERLAPAPASAPLLRARHASRAAATEVTMQVTDAEAGRADPGPRPTGRSRPAADHPWRRPSKPR